MPEVRRSEMASESCSPAPYGRACAACSRAKSKCFYRSDGSGCERCHRLGKVCEPATAVRKRKARSPQLQQPAPATRLEEKLDDLVSLLRSQAVEKQAPSALQTPQFTPNNSYNTPSTIGLSTEVNDTANARYPTIAIDTTHTWVQFGPSSPGMVSSRIFEDVSVHHFSVEAAEEQLETFRRAFIPMFPFVNIPTTMTSAEFCHQKPFLWLVSMSLTTKLVAKQFAIEQTIWDIISRRIISQHQMNMDLLLGVVCFASWSHYFKKDKPFMTMLSQIAVSLMFDLGLHKDISTRAAHQDRQSGLPSPKARTIEERRTLLAVFHLTASTWNAYRSTEPLRWTSYMGICLRILEEGKETELDAILASQVNCHIITISLNCSNAEGLSELPSRILVTGLLQQLNDIKQRMPDHIRSHRTTQFCLLSAELTIRDSFLKMLLVQDQDTPSKVRRLQDLDAILSTAENWLAVLSGMPPSDWVSISVENTTQFTHCLIVLFKLTTLDEPGWDLSELKRRANVFEILDRSCESIESVPAAVGMVDAAGSRRGFFFKTVYFLRAIKAMFVAKMPSGALSLTLDSSDTSAEQFVDTGNVGEAADADWVFMSLEEEPWFFDFMEYSYALGSNTVSHEPLG